jgi:signal transduction histidine kinase
VPMGYVITYNDVSELVGAQQDAIKTSDKLIEILETSPVGIGITTAEDHSIRWINSCGAKLLGFNSRGDVLGYSAQNCWISPEQRATFVDTFAKNGSVKAREVQLKNSLGNPFWCYLSWDKIHFENEDCILYWMFDITLKKEVQRQLFDSEKLASLGRLVAGVAHEINTPIGVGITATTYMLQQTENFFDVLNSNTLSKRGLKTYLTSTREGLDITFNNLKSAAHLVESFKQVSVDRISEKPRIIGLLDYFKDTIQSLHPKIKKAGVKVNLNSESDCSFYTYPGALSQIIANLISNSIIHGLEDKTDGIIDIQLSGKVGKAIKIQYQDNGVGIAENILFKVMDPFFTTKRNNGGTGLGLSIVHNIVVDKLHGTIKLTSTKGKGIKVAITIPSLSVKRPQPSLVEQKPLTHR